MSAGWPGSARARARVYPPSQSKANEPCARHPPSHRNYPLEQLANSSSSSISFSTFILAVFFLLPPLTLEFSRQSGVYLFLPRIQLNPFPLTADSLFILSFRRAYYERFYTRSDFHRLLSTDFSSSLDFEVLTTKYISRTVFVLNSVIFSEAAFTLPPDNEIKHSGFVDAGLWFRDLSR